MLGQVSQPKDEVQQEIIQLETTITTLEAHRHMLGDLVVDTALNLLRERLATLISPNEAPDERKRVTVLFADVSGYTALSENLDPEDVARIMNQLFEEVTAVIHKYNGTVDKYSGDAVMALFGAPMALENHEEMAVRAALGMQQVIARFSEQLQKERGFAIRMRIGLNTGEVLAGLVGGLKTRSYTVMGDTVNLASRLEHACPVGRVMISAETARPIRAIFEMEPPQQITVKGKSEPVTVYLVVGEKKKRERVRGIAGLFAPMIGRETELSRLQSFFTKAVTERRWLMSAVIGEAGIGKSRLQREFTAWIAHEYPEARIIASRCYTHTRTTPYHFIAELIRGLFQITPDATAETAVARLTNNLHALAPNLDNTEFSYQLGSLAGILGLTIPNDPMQNLTPEQRRDRTFLSLERIFTAAAQIPLCIIVDDLHWADILSLTFLERLIPLLEKEIYTDTPIMWLSLSRPAETPNAPLARVLNLLNQPPHLTLQLTALDTSQSQALIAALMDQEMPSDLLELVISHTQGNPFFMEEVLRTLIEEGTLIRDEASGHWQVKRDIADIHIPGSVRDVLAARLDRLPPASKRITQHAAIIGRTFWQRLLARITQADTIESHLLLLEIRQLAERLGQSQIAEDWEWVFHHVLIQEVAYASVPKATRRQIHQRVAQILEEQLTDQTGFLIPLIAFHYEQGGLTTKAIEYLQKAGEQAAAQFANEDAASYFGRALILLETEIGNNPPTPQQQAQMWDLLLGRVNAWHLSGNREAQFADLERLQNLAHTLGDPVRQATTFLRLADYYEVTSNYPQVVAAAHQAAQLATAAHRPDLKIQSLNTHALGLIRQGQFQEALALLQTARDLSQQHHDISGQTIAHHYTGLVNYFSGDHPAAKESFEQALALARQHHDLPRQTAALTNLVGVYFGLGELAQARRSGEAALTLARAIGDRFKEATILNNLGGIYHALGNLRQAYEYHLAAFKLAQALQDRRGESVAATNLGYVLSDLERYKEAAQYALHALQIDKKIGDRVGQGYSLTSLAIALEGQNQLDEAREHHEAALAIRRELGQQAASMDNLAGLARIA
ncbi:MAG: hypothetical protein D6706_04475, partial [Chloroflexi bacterium]